MDKRRIDLSLLSLTTPIFLCLPERDPGRGCASRQRRSARSRAETSGSCSRARQPTARRYSGGNRRDQSCRGIKEVCGISVGSNVNGAQIPDPRFEPNHGPEHVTELPISAEDKGLMLGGNAQAVFGLN